MVLASDQGRRGVLVTLVGDVASNYFLLRELDLQLDIARQTLRLNDETVTYFQNRLDGGVSNRLELDRIQANRALTAAAIPEIEQQIARRRERAVAAARAAARPRSARTRSPPDEALPPPIPAGLPASLLERRPDVVQAEQLLVAANADIGAAKAMFFPTISLTGFLGGVSGDLTTFLGGRGRRRGRSAPGCCSRCSRPAASAGTSKRCRRASTRRSPSIRRRRSTATAKWPTRW